MFYLFVILSISILLFGAYDLLFKYDKNETDYIKDENADNYLIAKEVFVRDPESFKDKDQDGIDDIIDKEV